MNREKNSPSAIPNKKQTSLADVYKRMLTIQLQLACCINILPDGANMERLDDMNLWLKILGSISGAMGAWWQLRDNSMEDRLSGIACLSLGLFCGPATTIGYVLGLQ